MRRIDILKFAVFGLNTILFHRKKPLIGSIIITDRCNLACRHCAVANVTGKMYPYRQIQEEMGKLYRDGIRILILYGGEPFLWEDEGISLRDLVKKAKEIGFPIVQTVTNGTFPLEVPEADLILVSLDGGREKHNAIRGDTYDQILQHIRTVSSANICLYMAINAINQSDIEEVCRAARAMPKVKAVSFNFHTPYPGTEALKLTMEEKRDCCDRLTHLIQQGYPIMNFQAAFPYMVSNSFPRPCHQCVIVENGQRWTCGRCVDVSGLCQECGFIFAAEFSLLFGGNIRMIGELFSRYLRFV